jgi:hypothetical protein
MMGWFFFSKPAPPPKPPRRKKIDDGLWYRKNGQRSITVEASPKWYEYMDDGSPISADSVKEFRSWYLSATGCQNEADAVAIRTVFWNIQIPCPRCSDETEHDDTKCVHCGARLWQQPFTVELVRVAK